ncbi:hypothetical protein X975_09983, partial [Stegodyphus mimosarum]
IYFIYEVPRKLCAALDGASMIRFKSTMEYECQSIHL